MKKFARIFLSREEKREVVEGNPWDLVIEEIQKSFSSPLLLKKDLFGDRSKRQWILRQLCERQEWKCFWCGELMTDSAPGSSTYRTMEHVIPKSTKGKNINKLSNLRAACWECNSTRSAWSTGSGKDRLITEQRLSIGRLSSENKNLKDLLTRACVWCRFKSWWKILSNKASRH